MPPLRMARSSRSLPNRSVSPISEPVSGSGSRPRAQVMSTTPLRSPVPRSSGSKRSVGMSRKARLHAATPGRRKRLARWFEPAVEFADGPFGGVAASGRNLVYSLILARYDDPDACIDKGACRAHVRGGGTMLLAPGSLKERRILSPASAVAVDGDLVAAAIVRPGSLYTGRAQIVVLNLATGALRFVGCTDFRRASWPSTGTWSWESGNATGTHRADPACRSGTSDVRTARCEDVPFPKLRFRGIRGAARRRSTPPRYRREQSRRGRSEKRAAEASSAA